MFHARTSRASLMQTSRRCRMAILAPAWGLLGILVIVVIGAVLREINLLIVLAGLMLGPMVVSWRLIRATLRRLEVSRRIPEGVFPDEPFVVELRIHNRRQRLDSWALRLEDHIRAIGDVRRRETVPTFLPHVAAGRTESTFYRGKLGRRGRYRLGPLRISTRVPVGLLQGTVVVKKTDDLLVYPCIGQLTTRWAQLVNVEQLGDRSHRRHQGPVEGDFYALREWQLGDSRRWIHWRSSARRRAIVVKQFEQYRSQDFVLLVDLRAEAGEAERLEQVISFAGTVLAEQNRRGTSRVALGLAGDSVDLVRGQAGPALLSEMLRLLADARRSDEDRLPELVEQAIPLCAAEDRMVVVGVRQTNLQDEQRFARSLVDPRHRSLLGQAITLAAERNELAPLFQLPNKNATGDRVPERSLSQHETKVVTDG